jgi:uncharacterized protein
MTRNIKRDIILQEIRDKVAQLRSYTPKVGVFGNAGAGKSSLCNALFGKDVALISDVAACTRAPQEILVGNDQGGIVLVDVPGIGEDPTHQKEYTELYMNFAPQLDLILWAIKADDRSYASAIDSHEAVTSSPNCPPILFVVTQADKTNNSENWNYRTYCPRGNQKVNITLKENDISKRFNVSARNIVSVAVSKKGKTYNLTALVDSIIKLLPNEKKFSITREVKEENVSDDSKIEAERGIWGYISDTFGDVVESVAESVAEIILESAPKKIMQIARSIGGFLSSWFR